METGETALAFAGNEAAELNGLAIRPNASGTLPAGWEICLVTDNVKSGFNHAVNSGATPVAAPAEKPWGQTVSYVRDLNGCLVEISSPVLSGTP